MSENIYRKGNICTSAPFTINHLDAIITALRYQDAKRPWASYTKTGPGRKHQQGKVLTKTERNKG